MPDYTLGAIQYVRPTEPIRFDEIAHILPIGGKDLIRIAWGSLNPDSNGRLQLWHLKSWFKQFFNLKEDADGTKCTDSLSRIGLLKIKTHSYDPDEVWPTFEL